jgi:hypothetical protein
MSTRKAIAIALALLAASAAPPRLAAAQDARLDPELAARLQAALRDPTVQARAQAAISACTSDRARLCSEVAPGGGRIYRCLARNSDRLAPNCRGAMQQAQDALAALGLQPSP